MPERPKQHPPEVISDDEQAALWALLDQLADDDNVWEILADEKLIGTGRRADYDRARELVEKALRR